MQFGLTKDLTVPLRMGQDRLQTYYDTQTVEQNTTQYNFFPPSASTSDVEANYDTNPLPEEKDRIILAFGLHLTHPILTDTNVGGDAVAFANQLSFGKILFTLAQDESKVLEEPTQRYLRIKQIGTRNDDGDSTTAEANRVVVEDNGLVMLNQQFGLSNSTKFGIRIDFDDASEFPASGQGFGIQATVQVAEGPNIIDRLRSSMSG